MASNMDPGTSTPVEANPVVDGHDDAGDTGHGGGDDDDDEQQQLKDCDRKDPPDDEPTAEDVSRVMAWLENSPSGALASAVESRVLTGFSDALDLLQRRSWLLCGSRSGGGDDDGLGPVKFLVAEVECLLVRLGTVLKKCLAPAPECSSPEDYGDDDDDDVGREDCLEVGESLSAALGLVQGRWILSSSSPHRNPNHLLEPSRQPSNGSGGGRRRGRRPQDRSGGGARSLAENRNCPAGGSSASSDRRMRRRPSPASEIRPVVIFKEEEEEDQVGDNDDGDDFAGAEFLDGDDDVKDEEDGFLESDGPPPDEPPPPRPRARKPAAAAAQGRSRKKNRAKDDDDDTTSQDKAASALLSVRRPGWCRSKMTPLWKRSPATGEIMCGVEGCRSNETWIAMYGLRQHFFAEHVTEEDKVYECDQCQARFAYRAMRSEHVRKNHRKKYVCTHEGCGRAFSAKHKLRDHLFLHTGEKPYVCDHCPYRCAKKCNLNAHMMAKHGDNSGRAFFCEICGKAFLTKSNLRGHITAVHEGGRLVNIKTGDTKKLQP